MPLKRNGPEQVAAFFDELDHPLKEAMLSVRAIILASDDSITEHVKWKAPSFMHGGDDRITFNLHRDGRILLIFHRGAKVKDSNGTGRLFDDTTGMLDWLADDRASVAFGSVEEVLAKQDDLRKIVKMWITAAR